MYRYTILPVDVIQQCCVVEHFCLIVLHRVRQLLQIKLFVEAFISLHMQVCYVWSSFEFLSFSSSFLVVSFIIVSVFYCNFLIKLKFVNLFSCLFIDYASIVPRFYNDIFFIKYQQFLNILITYPSKEVLNEIQWRTEDNLRNKCLRKYTIFLENRILM